MKVIKYKLNDSTAPYIITLGRVGEYGVTKVVFDFSSWKEKYGEGNCKLLCIPPGSEDFYPVFTEDTDDSIEWIVSAADTAHPGNGKVEIRYYVDDGIKKSVVINTEILASPFQSEGEAPDPIKEWVDEANEVLDEARESIEKIPETINNAFQEAKDSGEFKGDPGEQGPQGERGETGPQGIPGPPGKDVDPEVLAKIKEDQSYVKEHLRNLDESVEEVDSRLSESILDISEDRNTLKGTLIKGNLSVGYQFYSDGTKRGQSDYIYVEKAPVIPLSKIKTTIRIGGSQETNNPVGIAGYDINGNWVTRIFDNTIGGNPSASGSKNYIDVEIDIPYNVYYISWSSRIDGGITPYIDFIPSTQRIIYNKLKRNIVSLEKRNNETIPEYWESEVSNSETSCIARQYSMSPHSITFPFVTDVHWSTNAQKSPIILNKLCNDLKLPFVVCGGDIIMGHYSQGYDAIMSAIDFVNKFRIPLFTTLGNHDNNSDHNTDKSSFLSEGAMYGTMFRQTEVIANTWHTSHYGVLDNDSQKVRLIQFDTGTPIYFDGASYEINSALLKENCDFVYERISELSADWNVILITHEWWSPAGAGSNPNVSNTIKNAFVSNILDKPFDAKICAILCGHIHRDYDGLITSGDGTKTVKIIATTTDNCSSSQNNYGGASMVLGTDTEQAIDLFNIDFDKRKIYCIRVGAGNNREFSY